MNSNSQLAMISPKWRQIAISAAIGLAVGFAITVLSASISIALAFATMASVITFTFLVSSAKRRETKFELLWPDVVDHLITGIQSGMSLVEALSQLADRGPRELAPYFAEFNRQARKDGDFTSAIAWLQKQFSHSYFTECARWQQQDNHDLRNQSCLFELRRNTKYATLRRQCEEDLKQSCD